MNMLKFTDEEIQATMQRTVNVIDRSGITSAYKEAAFTIVF